MINERYSFLAPFFIGIKEAVNPYALTTILLFLLFLHRIGKNRQAIFLAGSCFISAVLGTSLLLCFGLFDFLFQYSFVLTGFRLFYLVAAIVFLFLGGRHFRGWRQYKKNKNQIDIFSSQWSFFSGRKIIIIISSIISGFLLTIFSSIWPQDYYMFLMFYYWVSKMDILLSVSSFIWYSMGFVFPLLVAWLIILMLISSQRLNKFFVQGISYVRIITSPIYFSIAISLIYLSIHK